MAVLRAGLVQIHCALRAQSEALLTAQHLCRHRQHERVARPCRQIDVLRLLCTGLRELLAAAWAIHLARVHLDLSRLASFKQRMHGPSSLAAKRTRKAYPCPAMRETSRLTGISAGLTA